MRDIIYMRFHRRKGCCYLLSAINLVIPSHRLESPFSSRNWLLSLMLPLNRVWIAAMIVGVESSKQCKYRLKPRLEEFRITTIWKTYGMTIMVKFSSFEAVLIYYFVTKQLFDVMRGNLDLTASWNHANGHLYATVLHTTFVLNPAFCTFGFCPTFHLRSLFWWVRWSYIKS